MASSTHSKVYKATHKLTKKTYALKTFPYCSTDIEYFLDLLNTYSNINGILKIKAYGLPLANSDYDILIENEIKYSDKLNDYIIATDFMENGNLADYNNNHCLNSQDKSNYEINPILRSKIIYKVALIMKTLHKNNILYIGLSSGNIFLDKNFEPLINAFTISKFLFCKYNNDNFMMNIAYTAPEILFDIDKKIDFPSDVYSFAIFVYSMFSKSNALFESCRSPKNYIQKIHDNI